APTPHRGRGCGGFGPAGATHRAWLHLRTGVSVRETRIGRDHRGAPARGAIGERGAAVARGRMIPVISTRRAWHDTLAFPPPAMFRTWRSRTSFLSVPTSTRARALTTPPS